MMGREAPLQSKLFYTNFNLERHIRGNHPLRPIAQRIDFEFAYQEVADTYGENGNISVPPPMVLKLMLLLVLHNVRSERELMVTLPERLDWLWFLGLDLVSPICRQHTTSHDTGILARIPHVSARWASLRRQREYGVSQHPVV